MSKKNKKSKKTDNVDDGIYRVQYDNFNLCDMRPMAITFALSECSDVDINQKLIKPFLEYYLEKMHETYNYNLSIYEPTNLFFRFWAQRYIDEYKRASFEVIYVRQENQIQEDYNLDSLADMKRASRERAKKTRMLEYTVETEVAQMYKKFL